MDEPVGTFQLYDFAAGWVSGICGLLVGHPADTVKVRQQTHGNRGAISVAISIMKTEGPLGFYRGLFMPLMSSGVMNSAFFGVYGNSVRWFASLRGEQAKRMCCDDINEIPTYKSFHFDVFMAGCLAGVVTTVGMCPFELCKIKLQTQFEHLKYCKLNNIHCDEYTGSLDCLIKLYKQGGLRFIFKGLHTMIWRDTCASGLYMYIYISGSQWFSETKTPSSIMISGGLAGALSWAAIMPLDVVKSRIQSDHHLNPKYKNMTDCFKKTYREGGLRIFMTGFTTTMCRALPVNAATFFSYETFIKFYNKYRKNNLPDNVLTEDLKL